MMAGSLPKLGATLRQEQPAPAARALQADLALETGSQGTAASPASPASTQPWPATLPEQVRAVAHVLASAPAAQTLGALQGRFKGKGPWKKSLPRILETLEALGRARRETVGIETVWRG